MWRKKGQTLVEYTLILVAIAMVVFGLYRAIGATTVSLSSGLSAELSEA